MANAIPKLVKAREELTVKINERLSAIFRSLTGRDQLLMLIYHNNFEGKVEITESDILFFLSSNEDLEIERGKIAFGPHKDNFFMTLDERVDKHSFSQGEYRISFLSLQLAINEIITQRLYFNPVVLLDDITSELDEQVINRTIEYISQKENQVFISSVKPLDSFSQGAMHRISHGMICTE